MQGLNAPTDIRRQPILTILHVLPDLPSAWQPLITCRSRSGNGGVLVGPCWTVISLLRVGPYGSRVYRGVSYCISSNLKCRNRISHAHLEGDRIYYYT